MANARKCITTAETNACASEIVHRVHLEEQRGGRHHRASRVPLG